MPVGDHGHRHDGRRGQRGDRGDLPAQPNHPQPLPRPCGLPVDLTSCRCAENGAGEPVAVQAAVHRGGQRCGERREEECGPGRERRRGRCGVGRGGDRDDGGGGHGDRCNQPQPAEPSQPADPQILPELPCHEPGGSTREHLATPERRSIRRTSRGRTPASPTPTPARRGRARPGHQAPHRRVVEPRAPPGVGGHVGDRVAARSERGSAVGVSGLAGLWNLAVLAAIAGVVVVLVRRPVERWRPGRRGKALSVAGAVLLGFHIGTLSIPAGAVVVLCRHRIDRTDPGVPLADRWPGWRRG